MTHSVCSPTLTIRLGTLVSHIVDFFETRCNYAFADKCKLLPVSVRHAGTCNSVIVSMILYDMATQVSNVGLLSKVSGISRKSKI